jgi:stage II sporulation protein M
LNWKDDLAYLKSIKNYILLSALLFVGTAILGYLIASKNPQLAVTYLEEIESKLEWILGLSPPMMMVFIFLNNLLASAMAMLLGIGFGVVPALIVSINGLAFGIVSYYAIEIQGIAYLIAGILPHGIIELPAVLISVGVGFRLGYLFLLSIRGEDVNLSGEMKSALRILIWVAFFLFLAAIIETFITPLAIQPFITNNETLSVMQ